MSSSSQSPTEVERVDVLLDQLLPRPGPPWRRFLVGLALTVAVVSVGLAWMQGLVLPRPTANGSYGGGGVLIHEPGRNAIAVSTALPNWSRRDVRITAVSLDAPGVRLVDVGVRLQPVVAPGRGGFEECEQRADGSEVCTVTGVPVTDDQLAPWPRTLDELPATLPAGGWVDVFLLIEPTSCQGPTELPWGHVDVTLDFGPGSFPPWSTTVRIEGPLVSEAGDSVVLHADRRIAHSPTGDDASTLLAALCELTGRD